MEPVTTYEVRIEGCDDNNVFTIDLTDRDASMLRQVGRLSKESSEHGCQPVLKIGVAA